MTYLLYRITDNAGDSGIMSQAIWLDEEGKIRIEENARPRVGVAMRVGSSIGRSYAEQDWWMTTPITEILEDYIEDDKEVVKFKTRNSVYVWRNC